MNRHLIAAALTATATATITGGTVATAAAPQAASAPAAEPSRQSGNGLADKLINQPASAAWNVFGAGQKTQQLANGGPQNYPVTRVTVTAKGANPWDVGAASPIVKPIAAGDTVLVAVYLRAPMLRDGETTNVSYLGLNQGAAPYDIIATASAAVTNQWKVFYASGRANKAYTPADVAAGLHLASEKHVIDLGPVRVFDLGQNVDPARLPKNG